MLNTFLAYVIIIEINCNIAAVDCYIKVVR